MPKKNKEKDPWCCTQWRFSYEWVRRQTTQSKIGMYMIASNESALLDQLDSGTSTEKDVPIWLSFRQIWGNFLINDWYGRA